MARINIEESWWVDPRRELLIKKMDGDVYRADGLALRLWRLGQEFWKKENVVPKDLFFKLPHATDFIECGLASEIEDGVYVKGSSDCFEWLLEHREISRKGGEKSAKRSRDNKGRLLPVGVQAESKRSPSESNRSPSESKLLPLLLTTKTKNQDSSVCEDLIERGRECVEEWGNTLKHYGIKKDPKIDEINILRLIKTYGGENTKLALFGARFEKSDKNYDSSQFVSIHRLLIPKSFDRFLNLGFQNRVAAADRVATPALLPGEDASPC